MGYNLSKFYKRGVVISNRSIYLQEIEQVLEDLEGIGSLNEIYEIIAIRNVLPYISTNKNWQARVRATIQEYCSEARAYSNKEDIFYPVYGLRGGVWGLKKYRDIITTSSISKFEERKITEIQNDKSISSTDKQAIIIARQGQGLFRNKILNKFSKCIITDIETPTLLIASHIKPWRDANNTERLSEENGLLLSILYDKLFDKGYITFSENTKLVISKKLSESDRNIINFETNKSYIPNCSSAMKSNLEYHRKKIFQF
ncbi:MAG: hypothetical protein ATN35_03330 [Epulopiscium sp. Nele67-Bin004]|nr:MAG: hypothetical protein ATN35_03330 [Epulopiscium sp. Nele67-Bin004]